MPDTIGNISVPEVTASGTFPTTPDYGISMLRAYEIVRHTVGNPLANFKIEQRFLMGTGARRWRVSRRGATHAALQTLRQFWEARKGAYTPFTFNAPDEGGTTAYTVRFANEPLSFEALNNYLLNVGVVLVEQPTSFPTWAVSRTLSRFPDNTLETQLAAQAQEIVPLIKIQPRASGYPAIYLSDRRCTVGGQLYQARLIEWDGIAQRMNEADDVRFTFGNADRVMRDLANDTDLLHASIEFSLFHVGSTTKLDLWKGEINDWDLDYGPEFRVQASEGIYELTLPYPNRKVSRSCWKKFNDGNNCPAASAGGTNLGVACDKSLDGSAGCRYHNMIRYFGGVEAKPQGVTTKDNSTGKWGIGRSNLTSTSIVSDTVYDKVLAQIYTDIAMPVPAQIISGRDEGDFYNALGIVGEGPLYQISQNTFDHSLDGSPPHGGGPQGAIYGFRAILGKDPATGSDGVFPSTGDHWMQLTETSGSPSPEIFAAGVAAAEIRRSDAQGLQLSRPSDHSMTVTVTGGIGGWTWSAPGSRAWWGTNVNPVWVAVNALLRARGVFYASAAVQETYFDVDAAIAAAAICNTSVTPMWGAGSETQYKFVGIIQEQKPLRDWIQEILMNCLGYWTNSFGKLKFGIRYNSSVVQAYTEGNIIYGSLKMQPLRPTFNHLQANFADREFNFAGNNVTIYDITHQEAVGGASSRLELRSDMNLVGTCTKSQAARLAVTRLREELGGISATEWKRARQGVLKTTILGLVTEPGQIISITHPDMPAGSGEARCMGWRLNKDYSIDLEWRTTTDSMYDYTIGPKPADVTADPLPVERLQEVVPLQPWFPDAQAPAVDDPILDETDKQFAVSQVYEDLTDGTKLAKIEVVGAHPITEVLDADPPRIASYAASGVGGSIGASKYVTVVLVATDAAGRATRGSTPVGVQVGGGSTNKITLSGITWPSDVTGGGYRIFAAVDQNLLSEQASGVGYPSSINLTSIANVRTKGLPWEFIDYLEMDIHRVRHSGVNGLVVTALTSTTLKVAGAGWTVNEWAGRAVSILADASDGSSPPLSFSISSNTADTLTISPNPVTAGVEVGDVLTIRTKATTYSSTTIGDSKFQNSQYPDGLAVDAEKGSLVRIIAGTGKGQERRIASNTATALTIDGTWDTTPSSDSVFVIIEAAAAYVAYTPKIKNEVAGDISLVAPVDNKEGQTYWVEVTTVDTSGRSTKWPYNPWQEIYCFGEPGSLGSALNEGYYEMNAALTITPDLANSLNQEIYLNIASTTINAPIWTGKDLAALAADGGTIRFRLILLQDATGGRAVTLHADYLIPPQFQLSLDPNTQTVFEFILQPDGKWLCQYFPVTGVPA